MTQSLVTGAFISVLLIIGCSGSTTVGVMTTTSGGTTTLGLTALDTVAGSGW